MPWRAARSAHERQALDAQPGEPALDRPRVGARVEQRAEQHVARDARRRSRGTASASRRLRPSVEFVAPSATVDAGAAHAAPPAERAIRAAIVPAPNPSSIPTTASPAAHEDEHGRAGRVTPPNAVP